MPTWGPGIDKILMVRGPIATQRPQRAWGVVPQIWVLSGLAAGNHWSSRSRSSSARIPAALGRNHRFVLLTDGFGLAHRFAGHGLIIQYVVSISSLL